MATVVISNPASNIFDVDSFPMQPNHKSALYQKITLKEGNHTEQILSRLFTFFAWHHSLTSNENILGLKELESLDKDLSLFAPGMMSTKDCASGTCIKPSAQMFKNHPHLSSAEIKMDNRSMNTLEINEKFGSLRG